MLVLVLATGSPAATIRPCGGSPRPIEAGLRQLAAEGDVVPTVLGVNCLGLGEALSDARIEWGDGATSRGRVTYVENADGLTRQAWIGAPHRYRRATCTGARYCWEAYPVRATATDLPTGAEVVVHGGVTVMPAPLSAGPVRVKSRIGARFRGPLAKVRTRGQRLPGELTARVRWGDGTRSTARVVGRDRSFVITGSHRWSDPGRLTVRVAIADHLRGATTVVVGSARVLR